MRFFLVFLFVSIYSFAQTKVKDTITYSEYNKLHWSDFKDKVPADTKYSASVCSGMSYKWSYSIANNIPEFAYEVEAKLYRNLSWSKYTEGKEEVLSHEQLHFDISELYARKFRKQLSEYEVSRNVRKDVGDMYENLEKERLKFQLMYDSITEHSLNKEAQIEWNLKVNRLLNEYDAYK